MDPQAFEELDSLPDAAKLISQKADHRKKQEREWQEFVRRREEEERRERERLEDEHRQQDELKSQWFNPPVMRPPNVQAWQAAQVSSPPVAQQQPSRTPQRKAFSQREAAQQQAPLPPQQQEQKEDVYKDPLADFCMRMMAGCQKRVEEEQAVTEIKPDDAGRIPGVKSVKRATGRPVVPALTDLLDSIDQAEEEEREYEAVKPLLPSLGDHAARVSSSRDLASRTDNPMVRHAVRYMQEQRPEFNFEELMRAHAGDIFKAGKYAGCVEGHMASVEYEQRALFEEEAAWRAGATERREHRHTRMREACKEALVPAAKNTKIAPVRSGDTFFSCPTSGAAGSSSGQSSTRPPTTASSQHSASPSAAASSSSAGWREMIQQRRTAKLSAAAPQEID